MGVMSRLGCGAPAFTEHNNSNFIGGFHDSLRDWQTGLDPDPSGTDSIHVSGCTPHLELDGATSITTNGRIPISKGLKAASGKGKFQPDNRNSCEKYNDSDDDEWFLGFDEKVKDVYMKHCKFLIEPIVESKHKKKGTKADNKVVDVEREEERDPEVDGEKEVDKGRKQTSDEMLLPNRSY